jgi:hypothetical protein
VLNDLANFGRSGAARLTRSAAKQPVTLVALGAIVHCDEPATSIPQLLVMQRSAWLLGMSSCGAGSRL